MPTAVKSLDCPKCGCPLKLNGTTSNHECRACATQFLIEGVLCAHCHQHHDQLQPNCSCCGKQLSRMCRRCCIPNKATDEYCSKCGIAMDILDLGVADHRHRTRELRKKIVSDSPKVRQQVNNVVRSCEAAAVKAMEEHNAELVQALEKAQQDGQKLLRAASVVFAVLVGLCVLGLIIS